MHRQYTAWSPGTDARSMAATAEAICDEYAAQGYEITLRQLYYQFVARDLIPNTNASYKRLGDVVNRARLGGLIDWTHIEDRTRSLSSVPHWRTPADVIRAAARSYRLDKWTTQPARVEVWVEKEALAGVIGRAADGLDVPWFSCRGYVSQSEMWVAGQRLGEYLAAGQRVVVLHLGDHDPSGLDMTRDIRDRLNNFLVTDWHHANVEDLGHQSTVGDILEHMTEAVSSNGEPVEPFEVRRIALNMDQVEQYDPPPNPAKVTDSRAADYIETYGSQSWELDALDPSVLADLITEEVNTELDAELFDAELDRESDERDTLARIAGHYRTIAQAYGHE